MAEFKENYVEFGQDLNEPITHPQLESCYHSLYEKYFVPGSDSELNMPVKIVETLQLAMDSSCHKCLCQSFLKRPKTFADEDFLGAVKETTKALYFDNFPRYAYSPKISTCC